MNKWRAMALVVFGFLLCFVLVHLEGEKVRAGRAIAGLRGQIRRLDYERWALQARLAGLVSPGELEERWASMPTGALPPMRMVAAESGSGEAVAVGQVGR